MSPWIGITTYERHPHHGWTVPAAYVDAVRVAGGIPVLLTPGEGDPQVWLARLDGLIVSGGCDVCPSHYQSDPHPQGEAPNPERDQTELGLVRAALNWPHPVLCICRGMQLLNVALGGSLIQHLPEWSSVQAHRSATGDPVTHGVRVAGGSRLGQSYGIEDDTDLEIVSWHHQGIERLAPGLRAVSWAVDGLVEAVEVPEHPWYVGVQWHPEMSLQGDRDSLCGPQTRLFEAFVQQAAAQALVQAVGTSSPPGRPGGDR